MSTNASSDAGANTIQLDAMSLEQLDQLKQGEEQRMQALAQRFAALRQAATRLTAATTAVQELCVRSSEDEACKDVFVPLTESVYIPGKVRIPSDPLLIELGTGYFVEKDPEGAVDFLQRKLRLVDANSENVTQAVQATKQNLESIAIAMRGKLMEIQARQQGQRARAAAESS